MNKNKNLTDDEVTMYTDKLFHKADIQENGTIEKDEFYQFYKSAT